MLWTYLRMRAALWLWRASVRTAGVLLLAAVLAALAPITVTASLGYLAAWLRGWPPARLLRTAAWSLLMPAAWLAGLAVPDSRWHVLVLAPVRAWQRGWHDVQAGRVLAAVVLSVPVGVPAGLAAAAGLWAWRIYAVESGLSGRTASAPAIFDARQWRRSARARAAAPGAVPLTDGQGRIVAGTTIRAVG